MTILFKVRESDKSFKELLFYFFLRHSLRSRKNDLAFAHRAKEKKFFLKTLRLRSSTLCVQLPNIYVYLLFRYKNDFRANR